MKAKLLALALLLAAAPALAAETTVVITVTGASATSVTCNGTTSFTAPVAPGTTICPVVVEPAGWAGSYTLTGANATLFALAAGKLVVGGTALPAGDYTVRIIVAP
jgi:hypothetical protein